MVKNWTKTWRAADLCDHGEVDDEAEGAAQSHSDLSPVSVMVPRWEQVQDPSDEPLHPHKLETRASENTLIQ